MHELIPHIPGYLADILRGVQSFMPEIYLGALFIIVLITDLIFGRNSSLLCKIVACAGLFFVMVKDLEQIGLLMTAGRSNGHLFFNEMLHAHPYHYQFQVHY